MFTRFWKYTQNKHLVENKNNELCCDALKEIVKNKLFHIIENITIIKDAYNKIVKACKLKKSNAVFVIFRRFAIFKLFNYSSINNYSDQFREFINKLNMLLTYFHISEMWYIYQYFDDLKKLFEVLIFIDRWVLDHESIDENNNESKFRLNNVIHDYETKYINLFNDIQKNTDVTSLVTKLIVIDFKQKSAQSKITDSAHSKIVIQTIK